MYLLYFVLYICCIWRTSRCPIYDQFFALHSSSYSPNASWCSWEHILNNLKVIWILTKKWPLLGVVGPRRVKSQSTCPPAASGITWKFWRTQKIELIRRGIWRAFRGGFRVLKGFCKLEVIATSHNELYLGLLRHKELSTHLNMCIHVGKN